MSETILRLSSILMAVSLNTKIQAQEIEIDLSELPAGYTFESEGGLYSSRTVFTGEQNGSYICEVIDTNEGGTQFPKIVVTNSRGQTQVRHRPNQSYYYVPHDCVVQLAPCDYRIKFEPGPYSGRNYRTHTTHTEFVQGVWVNHIYPVQGGGSKTSQICYTLDEYGLRLDWMKYEFNPETFEFDLLVDWGVRTLPEQSVEAALRLNHIRNMCLFDLALS